MYYVFYAILTLPRTRWIVQASSLCEYLLVPFLLHFGQQFVLECRRGKGKAAYFDALWWSTCSDHTRATASQVVSGGKIKSDVTSVVWKRGETTRWPVGVTLIFLRCVTGGVCTVCSNSSQWTVVEKLFLVIELKRLRKPRLVTCV